MAACSEVHTKHINTFTGQNTKFFNLKLGGTWCSHRALKDYPHRCAAGQLA